MSNSYADVLSNPFIPNVRFELISISNLVSDQNYQRNLSKQKILKAVKDFNPYQINPVKVSRREGLNYVFDGQHTVEIIAQASGSRETPVWCMVFDDLIYTEEADIFANQRKHTTPLRPYEIFNANCEAGNEKQLMIKSIVESFGLKITPTKQLDGICAISALELIYDKYGKDVLIRTLSLCIGAWEGAENSFSANILKGIAQLVVAFGDSLKDEIFSEKVGRVPIKIITRNAKDRGQGALYFADAILSEYNKKMRYPLRRADLYSKNKIKQLQQMANFENTEECFEVSSLQDPNIINDIEDVFVSHDSSEKQNFDVTA